MNHGAAAFIGTAVYILLVLADCACLALCYFRGGRTRWLCPLVFGMNAIPVFLFGFAFCSGLREMRTNADAGIAAVAAAVMAIPFLACFIAAAIVWYRQRKLATASTQ